MTESREPYTWFAHASRTWELRRRRSHRFFVRIAGDDVGQAADDFVRLDPFGLRIEIRNYAVAEDCGGDGADIFAGDVVTAVQYRAGLGRQDQKLAGPRSGAPGDVVADEVGHVALVFSRQTRELHGVTDDVRGHWHLAHDVLHLQDVGRRQHAVELRM